MNDYSAGIWTKSGIKCPNCGSTNTEINLMEVLTSMPPQNKYRCKCGHWWISTEYKIQTDFQDILPPQKKTNGSYGWICPVCGAGVSPYQDHCPCCSGKSLTPTWTCGTSSLGYKGEFNGGIKGIEATPCVPHITAQGSDSGTIESYTTSEIEEKYNGKKSNL